MILLFKYYKRKPPNLSTPMLGVPFVGQYQRIPLGIFSGSLRGRGFSLAVPNVTNY